MIREPLLSVMYCSLIHQMKHGLILYLQTELEDMKVTEERYIINDIDQYIKARQS